MPKECHSSSSSHYQPKSHLNIWTSVERLRKYHFPLNNNKRSSVFLSYQEWYKNVVSNDTRKYSNLSPASCYRNDKIKCETKQKILKQDHLKKKKIHVFISNNSRKRFEVEDLKRKMSVGRPILKISKINESKQKTKRNQGYKVKYKHCSVVGFFFFFDLQLRCQEFQ